MTDLEISKALALAIGWTEDRRDENGCLDPDVITEGAAFGQESGVFAWCDGIQWRRFDYRDPAVIWPIAERYGCFPSDMVSDDFKKHQQQGYPDIEGWEVFMTDYKRSTLTKAKWLHYRADTAAKAVALAVIGSAK